MNDHVWLGTMIPTDANPSWCLADCYPHLIRPYKDKKHIANQWSPRRHSYRAVRSSWRFCKPVQGHIKVGKHTEATIISDAKAGTCCALTASCPTRTPILIAFAPSRIHPHPIEILDLHRKSHVFRFFPIVYFLHQYSLLRALLP